MKTKGSEFKLGWKALFAGVLGVALGASPIPYNIIGFTIGPLSDEFGWTRTQILAPITIFGITASLLAPFFGWLADKYGVRRVALWSLFAFSLSLAAISLTPSSLTVYYALWLLMGLVGIGSTPVTWSRSVNLWFYEKRGLALGILLLGTSLAPLFVPHIAVYAIENVGWRGMFVMIALLPLLIALPICLLYFREPTYEEQPKQIKSSSGQLAGVTLSQALRDYRFWLIWSSVVLIALTFGGAFVNMVPILTDRGFSTAASATVMTLFGAGIFSGRIITGLLLDRFWAGFVAFPMLCLPALSSLILLGDNVELSMAILGGYLLGFAAGAESDLIAYLTGRYFGMANYGKIYGMLYMPFGICSAVSPLLYAYIRDTSGSYNPMLVASIPMYVAGGALLLFLGKYPISFAKKITTIPSKPVTSVN
jgi:OFA family oxalate/formate antiporter-like MFS transporter